MDRHSQRLVYGLENPSREHKDFVILEQEPWDPYIGFLTKFGVYAYINSILFNEEPPNSNCSSENLARWIWAYPSREDLNYIIGCSWGELTEKTIQEVDYTEDVQINLEEQFDLKYPAQSITRSSWIGDVYTSEGEVVEPKPEASVSTDGGSLPFKVYGTLLVTYKVVRHRYGISITPRTDAEENKLQSFIFACWNGGNNYMEIEAPTGAEDGECNYNVDTALHVPPDDQPPDHVDPKDEYVDIDYCTGLEAI